MQLRDWCSKTGYSATPRRSHSYSSRRFLPGLDWALQHSGSARTKHWTASVRAAGGDRFEFTETSGHVCAIMGKTVGYIRVTRIRLNKARVCLTDQSQRMIEATSIPAR